VEGLRTVGDILTKISFNCVMNLHVALLFTFLFYGFILFVVYNCFYIYGYFLYMLHVFVYCYFSMNPCTYIMYFPSYISYINFSKSSLCICFNYMQFKKFIWNRLVGCWLCYSMLIREYKHFLE
jgi:hypothetical protein